MTRGLRSMLACWPKLLFFVLVVRPVAWIVLGMNVRHAQRLPRRGPAIIAANHNSHLDALVLMSLFPLRDLPRLRPLAAGDYFFRSRWRAWFARRVIGAIAVERSVRSHHAHPLAAARAALDQGDILIIFPEGSRGEPERLHTFRSGVAHLARACPGVLITPVFLHGLGKALPKGEALLVPFFCDVFVGEPLYWCGERAAFMAHLAQAVQALAGEAGISAWE